METLFGIPLVENPLIPETQPKVRLSSKVDVSEAFREEYNQWLADFFGVECVAYVLNPGALPGHLGGIAREMIAMNPMIAQQLRVSLRG